MKILIIGAPRTGTTSLTEGLGAAMGRSYRVIREPYNYHKVKYFGFEYTYPYEWRKDCVVKMLVDQVPKEFNGNHVEFFNQVSTEFDRVIILKREGFDDAVLSYQYAMANNAWHEEYSIEEDYDTTSHGWFVGQCYGMLHEIQASLKIPFTWYEDIYSGDKGKIDLFIKDNRLDLDYDKLFSWINPNRRYRKVR